MMDDPKFGIPPNIARKLALSACHNENAVVIGNRAGVIEWANEAWSRVTGYALDESISKPVLTFLREVDVEPGVVEFVGSCFTQGKVCEVEVPITTPDGRNLWIQLRVEPLRDDSHEVTDFIAIATDVTERKRAQANTIVDEIDLSVLAARLAREHAAVLGPCTDYDLYLAESLPLVLVDVSLIEDLIGRLICRGADSIGDGWGTLTIWTGILGVQFGPVFDGDLFEDLPPGHYAFLEVHDTGGEPAGDASRDTTEPFENPHFSQHSVPFDSARLRIRNLGGELRMQSSRSGGTSVVLLLPFCGGEDLELP
ncbi:MAG: PAS domain-containing protein [Myxococcales bacterium]|nr:PAS domain-containing protein [Myxococcales bacterium]